MDPIDFSAIPAPSGKCMVCDRDLASVGKHPSVLHVDEKGEPQRRDICPDCWEKMADRKFFSFWLTQREPPKPDPRVTREEQNRRLMALFEQMRDSGDERFRPHLYVLAHALMKRRLLKWEGTKKDEKGMDRIVFRSVANGELIQVEEVDIEDEATLAIMRQIDSTLAKGTTDETIS